MYNRGFYPGQPWFDTEGKPIQAHGGSILFWKGSFYWYGENKEKTTGKENIWHWGVRCYSSKDLYNWKDEGVIIQPEPKNPLSSLHPSACMDRPHILYHQKSHRFICWLKIMNPNQTQTVTILTSPHLLGPYEKIREHFQPLQMNAGDFDLVISPSDQKAYYYFERVHSELICADLTEDYTNVTGYYTSHFPRKNPPFVREAPAYFFRKGIHYLVTSGTTGYYPNPSELACSLSFHGPFTVLGSPHRGEDSSTSFRSQISSVFRVPFKKDLYIALADRWLPDDHTPYPVVCEHYRSKFEPDYPQVSTHLSWPHIRTCNTSIATYVWLPFHFEGNMGYLDWKDEWSLDEYE